MALRAPPVGSLLATGALLLVAGLCSPSGAAARSAPVSTPASPRPEVVVTVRGAHPGRVIPEDFLGLSLETPAVHTRAVVSAAPALAHLLSGLGSGLLRISGDSIDHTQWLSPGAPLAPWAAFTLGPTDIANLAALMRASGWRLILGLDLGHPLAAAIVEEARAAVSTLGPALAALEIGNEPDLYTRPPVQHFQRVLGKQPLRPRGWGLSNYEQEVARLRDTLAAAGVSAPLWGPDTAPSSWLTGYLTRDPAGIAALTAHLYPLDRCRNGRIMPGPSLASLLDPGRARGERRLIKRFLRAATSHALPLRIDETNSVACAGKAGASDNFGAALWALDYALIAASEGVPGLNFHGGLGSCSEGGTIFSPWYSPLCALPNGQLRVRPEYYALLLVHSLEGCAFVQASYRTARNVAVFALRAPDGTLRAVIDDMELPAGTAPGAGSSTHTAPVDVLLSAERAYRHGSVIWLRAPRVTATQGATLGGRSVAADGRIPAAVPQALAGSSGRFRVQMTPGSAAVVSLRPGGSAPR